jgi:hypothetical protein
VPDPLSVLDVRGVGELRDWPALKRRGRSGRSQSRDSSRSRDEYQREADWVHCNAGRDADKGEDRGERQAAA